MRSKLYLALLAGVKRFGRSCSVSLFALLSVMPFLAAPAAAQSIGTVYTNRPQFSSAGIYDNLEVTFSANNSLDSSTYSAVATPGFASSSNTFSNPAIFGGFATARSNFLTATAPPGGAVKVDVRGRRLRPAFSGSFFNPLISGTFKSRWYPGAPVVVFPGVVIGTSGVSPCGWRWVYINGTWVEVDPCPLPVNNVSVTFGIAPQPDPDENGQQLMRAKAYRLDLTAQNAVAAHFGAASFDSGMVRTLGDDLLTLGFPGEIGVLDLGSRVVEVGESFSESFGAIPASPDDLLLMQVVTQFTAPLPNQSAEPIEYWMVTQGGDLIPEPGLASSGMLLLAFGRSRRVG